MPNLERLREVRNFLSTIPEDRFDLCRYFTSECGTLACGLGHLALQGMFGLSRDPHVSYKIRLNDKVYEPYNYGGLGQEIFDLCWGDSCSLFTTRGDSELDDGWNYMSDRAMLLTRFDKLIAHLETKGE